MRLIDADKLNIDFYDEYETEDDVYACEYVSKHQIDEAPSIDIVRCKECKWYDNGQNESDSWSYCTRHFGHYIDVNDDDFCSYGERSRR